MSALIAVIGVLPSGGARALDAFEIQVYDGTANPAGSPGLELHVNDVVRASTTAMPPELTSNHQAHFTLEPSYGVTDFWELGAYLQTAPRPDGTFDYAGVKARSKLVTRPSWSTTRRMGLNLELSDVPARYEAERWGLELRPIVAQDLGRFSVVVNPIIGIPLTGRPATFEPAAEVLFAWPRLASLGLEYYADFGDVAAFSRVRDQKHYLFEVANLLGFRSFELNVGVGEGLTATSNPLVAKLILGYQLDARRAPP
jgi:hypothetical protein